MSFLIAAVMATLGGFPATTLPDCRDALEAVAHGVARAVLEGEVRDLPGPADGPGSAPAPGGDIHTLVPPGLAKLDPGGRRMGGKLPVPLSYVGRRFSAPRRRSTGRHTRVGFVGSGIKPSWPAGTSSATPMYSGSGASPVEALNADAEGFPGTVLGGKVRGLSGPPACHGGSSIGGATESRTTTWED